MSLEAIICDLLECDKLTPDDREWLEQVGKRDARHGWTRDERKKIEELAVDYGISMA